MGVREGDFHRLGAEAAALLHGGADEGLDFGVGASREVLAREADAHALQGAAFGAGAGRGEGVADGLGAGRGVVGIGAGDDGVDAGGVLDGARHRAHLVEGGGERGAAVAGDAAVGRLEARDAAEGRGLPDAAAGIRPQRRRGQARRHRRRAAAAAAAGDAGGVPGVFGRAVGAGFGAAAHREFVCVRAGDEDRAGRAEAGDDRRVVGGDVALEDVRARSAGLAADVQEVFDRDGDAEEGLVRSGAGGAGLVRGTGLGEGVLRVVPGQRVQLGLEGIHALQQRRREFLRRGAPRRHRLQRFPHAQYSQFFRTHFFFLPLTR